MKTYKYSTSERAERVSKTLGCVGSHYHNENGDRKYMPCKSHNIFLSKTKNKKKGDEQEVTELVDTDGTFLSSNTPILDPASTGINTKTTDQIIPSTRNPRNPLLRGWYGYYGEGRMEEEDMSRAFGYEDTKDMDAEDTIDYYQDKLELDKNSAVQRATQQGKKVGRDKRTPKSIKNKKNFIDRLILKEKEIEEGDIYEDILLDKEPNDQDSIQKKLSDIHPLLIRNIKLIKKMAKENQISVKELLMLIKNEQ